MAETITITAELRDLVSGQIQTMTGQVNGLDNALQNVGRRSQGGGLMSQVLGANLLTGAIQKAGGAIVDFGKDSVDAYSKQEGYEARLTTLLGDRKTAMAAIDNLRQDAAKTPFDVESLVEGNSLLIGSGASAKEARKSIMDLGNAIAATGGGSDELRRMAVNLGQIKSIGKASALDVKQFMYANIPIYDLLAKSMKKSSSEIKGMDITYKDLTKALSEAREEGGKFYHGIENASGTLKGLKSNLDDTIESLKANIGETFADTLKESLTELLPLMNDLNQELSNINKTARVLKDANLDLSFSEKFMPNAKINNLTTLKSDLDKSVQASQGGESDRWIQEKKLENYLQKITSDYQKKAPELNRTAYGFDAAKMYRQEVALVSDALDSIKKLSKSDKSDKGNGAGKEPSDLEKVAKANRPTQINIDIENLVREYKPQVMDNGKEVYKITQQDVAKALIAAVNDISVLQFGQ